MQPEHDEREERVCDMCGERLAEEGEDFCFECIHYVEDFIDPQMIKLEDLEK